MAKTQRPNLAGAPPPGSELIVVMKPDVGIRSRGDTIAAESAEVGTINAILSNFNAKIIPIFGAENRIQNMSPRASNALEISGIQANAFYLVESAENLNDIAQAMLNEELVETAYVKPPAEPPVRKDMELEAPDVSIDAPPVTPNFVDKQVYLNAAAAGIDARFAWTLPGGKGDGVRIIDIEGAWLFTHEDLTGNQGGVIGGTASTDINWRNHGTAVIGVFGGDENSIGVTGICPNANTRAISIFGGTGSAGAIRQAADALSAGDIILIELHRPGPRHNFQQRDDQLGYIAVEWWPDDFAAILYASSKGVLVVEAAGNGAENLSDALYNQRPVDFPPIWRNPFNVANPSSNAIFVGAGAPPPGTHGRDHGPDRSRLDFSNFGARVDCQGWGREVTTAGYGFLQAGDERFWYTDTFSGTSSASPIVVGALGCLQGRLRNRNRPLLTPITAKNLLRTTGSVQQAAPNRPVTQRIGNRPNLRQAFQSLNIGSKIKDIKEFKEKDFKELKEKDGKEFKELKEVKEFKEKDLKEFKEKDLKEFKEKDKDIHEVIREGDFTLNAQSSSLEDRMRQLESMMHQLSHFISIESRPDLQSTLLQGSEEVEFQKNSNEAKNQKDAKEADSL